jgi:7-carboxy-7-deazaguanine synthase
MVYNIKEIFLTLQGEGAQAGRAAVFCRFAGCNLWSGREQDRQSALCSFCDTDFVGTDGIGGGRFSDASHVMKAIEVVWQGGIDNRLIVFTGGEPLLQLDDALIAAAHEKGFSCAVETNGTITVPDGIDWICVSPKANAPLTQKSGHELKFVYPQDGLDPVSLETLDFNHFFLQPMDGPNCEQHTRAAIAYCQNRPLWRLSVQMHKILGIN